MTNDKDLEIKPAVIEDEELAETMGGLRIAYTGIRATDVKLDANALTIDARNSYDVFSPTLPGDQDMVLRKRPGR
jgi:hypothetical protein